jgi:hypothetical protein
MLKPFPLVDKFLSNGVRDKYTGGSSELLYSLPSSHSDLLIKF